MTITRRGGVASVVEGAGLSGIGINTNHSGPISLAVTGGFVYGIGGQGASPHCVPLSEKARLSTEIVSERT